MKVKGLKRDKDNNVICPECGESFKPMGFSTHYDRKHTDIVINYKTPWNKGLTKEDVRVKNNLKSLLEYQKKNGNVWKGKKLPKEMRKNISESLKKAHKEGRHPGWKHINENKDRRSWPEEFLIEVMKNNGVFKKYKIQEKYSFGKYFLDFAFIDLKLDVEMDGAQHFRNIESIEHDKTRDNFLKINGWKVYRIKWIDMMNDSKNEINRFLDYISACNSVE